MQRIGRIAQLKPGTEQEYKKWHEEIWPELRNLISQSGITNYTIFLFEGQLFSYLEVEDWEASVRFLSDQPTAIKWQSLMAPLMQATDPISPWQLIEEIFHLP